MSIFTMMNPSISTAYLLRASLALVAVLYLWVNLHSFASNKPFKVVAETAVMEEKGASPLEWRAIGPIEASSGIMHAAESLLLPLVLFLLACLIFFFLQPGQSAYTRAPYKIFDFYQILPNAP